MIDQRALIEGIERDLQGTPEGVDFAAAVKAESRLRSDLDAMIRDLDEMEPGEPGRIDLGVAVGRVREELTAAERLREEKEYFYSRVRRAHFERAAETLRAEQVATAERINQLRAELTVINGTLGQLDGETVAAAASVNRLGKARARVKERSRRQSDATRRQMAAMS